MSLKKELTSGVSFIALAKYSGIIVSLAISAILSRLLTPTEFGVVGAATVFIAFFNILGDIGIGPAIIQRKNLEDKDLKEIFSLTCLIGIALSVLFFCCSTLIAKFYNDDLLIPICKLLSLQILFTCIGIVPINLYYKQKRFKQIAFISLSVQIISGAAAVIYAFSGGGVYALVIQSVISRGLITLIFWYCTKLRISPKITKASISKIFSFSVYQSLFNIINYFSRNLDKILIGRFIGLNQLGYYDKSYRMMMLPLQNITFVITPVLLPVFSELQNDRKTVAQKYTQMIGFLGFIAFPISSLLFFCGKELIILFFGDQWYPAILPFQILSFTVCLQILTSTTGSIYQSVDATKQLFISGCWGAFFMVVAFSSTIFIWGNIVSVCIGYLIAQLANTIQCFWLLYKTLDTNIHILLKSIINPLCCGITTFSILSLISILLPSNLNLWMSLILKFSVFVLILFLYIQLFTPYNPIQLIKSKFINSNKIKDNS